MDKNQVHHDGIDTNMRAKIKINFKLNPILVTLVT